LDLRDQFQKAGRRDLERRVTFALERTRTRLLLRTHSWLEAGFRWLFWEMPTAYDLHPERALTLLVISIVAFAIPYFLALAPDRPVYLWLMRPRDRPGSQAAEQFSPLHVRNWRRLRLAFLFSIYSAFEVGWGQLTVAR
jgi:hypothetical protein